MSHKLLVCEDHASFESQELMCRRGNQAWKRFRCARTIHSCQLFTRMYIHEDRVGPDERRHSSQYSSSKSEEVDTGGPAVEFTGWRLRKGLTQFCGRNKDRQGDSGKDSVR